MITLAQIQIKLSEAIKQSELTQTEIAKRIGIKHQQISCYISGIKMPALDTLANLCAVLDLDANDILCIDEAKSSSNSKYHISTLNNNGGKIDMK